MLEQPLHDAFVLLAERFVIVAKAMLERLLQPGVGDMLQVRREVGFLDVQEPRSVVVRATMRNDIVRSQATLPARRNEDYNGFVR